MSAGARIVVVMGVSGTGKSTVGGALAEALGVPYAEADDFHPEANIAKMADGVPLDDADREPWLDALGAWARDRPHDEGGGPAGVLSCSALRRRYRDRLRDACPGLYFVHLTGSRELIASRLSGRRDHFMPAALLDSQFAALEPLEDDEHGITLDVAADAEAVTGRALAALAGRPLP
jgi:gluconokinase